MKLTEKQKQRYITACTSAICRCLIPNVIEIVLNLNNIKSNKCEYETDSWY